MVYKGVDSDCKLDVIASLITTTICNESSTVITVLDHSQGTFNLRSSEDDLTLILSVSVGYVRSLQLTFLPSSCIPNSP